MPGFLGPARRFRLWVVRRACPEPFAILSLQQTPIPRRPPLKIGNIVGQTITRLVGALMLETNDEWAVARRYMSLETLARLTHTDTVRLPAVAA